MSTSTTGERESDVRIIEAVRRVLNGSLGCSGGTNTRLIPTYWLERLHVLASRASMPEAGADDVERVARALCVHDGYNPDETGDTHDCGVPKDWPLWRVYEAKARAALSAMPGSDYAKKARAEVLWALKRWQHVMSPEDLCAALFDAPAMQDALRSTSVPEPRDEGKRFQHVKTGGFYNLVGRAKVQSNEHLVDMDDVVIYRSEKDGSLWARPRSEFEDGRFVATPPVSGGGR